MSKKHLWQYVISVDPSATNDDVIEIKEINEWDLLIVFRNGKRVIFDRFTGYHKNLFHNNINDLTEEQEKKEFAYRLRSLMGRRMITQETLAEKINVTQTMISRYVRGESMPNAIILRKIAKVLRCSMDDFFDRDF